MWESSVPTPAPSPWPQPGQRAQVSHRRSPPPHPSTPTPRPHQVGCSAWGPALLNDHPTGSYWPHEILGLDFCPSLPWKSRITSKKQNHGGGWEFEKFCWNFSSSSSASSFSFCGRTPEETLAFNRPNDRGKVGLH